MHVFGGSSESSSKVAMFLARLCPEPAAELWPRDDDEQIDAVHAAVELMLRPCAYINPSVLMMCVSCQFSKHGPETSRKPQTPKASNP